MNNTRKILKNENGILTIDFLFAFMMIFGFIAILYSFAFTFSVVEVVQYISFSSARAYNLAHLNEDQQRERAELKSRQLIQSPTMTPFISSGWFRIGDAQIGDFNDEYPTSGDQDSANFVGVRIPFSAPVLYKRIPLLGATGNDPEGFTANINSFLSREPTFQECQSFMGQRGDAISGLGYTATGVVVIMDNGC